MSGLKEVTGPDLPTSDGTEPAQMPQQRAPEPAITEPSEPFVPQPAEGGEDADKFTVGDPETPSKDDDTGDPPEPKPSRRARRTQRYDELQQRASAAETAAQEANARAARMEGMLQAYQTLQQQQQQQAAPRQEPKDPEEEAFREANAIADQMENLSNSMQSKLDDKGKLPPEYEAKYRKEYNKLQFQYHKAVAKSMQPQTPAQAPTGGDMRAEARKAQIEAQFPDVVYNPQASQYAQGEYNRLVALGHPAESMQTLQWAWHAARAQFGQQPQAGQQPQGNGQPHPQMQPVQYPQYPQAAPPPPPPAPPGVPYYPAPPQSYMPPGAGTRMVGAPQGSGGQSGGGPVEVKMTPDMKKMADHAFGHIKDPKQRYQYYVNNVVKPHLIRMKQMEGQ